MADCRLDPCVEGELWEIWSFIARDKPDAATSVVEAAYRTFEAIAAHPQMGRLCKFRDQRLRGMRSLRIEGYPNYLVFYRAVSGSIHIHHVYHGARDLDALFRGE